MMFLSNKGDLIEEVHPLRDAYLLVDSCFALGYARDG